MDKKQARRSSRIVATEALFTYLSRDKKIPIKECFDHVLEVEEKTEDDFAWKILDEAVANMGKVKVIIRGYAMDFAFDKIAPINRVLLILGITEMKFFETPPIVVINEYIEIAKDFGEERSAAFVNGVLDNFRKNIGKEREKILDAPKKA